ncbi:MAG: hypothetical protein H7Z41_06100 [Cytophagales bacterium]|nr:hypothetical protein [Armatimonadota bacterium]
MKITSPRTLETLVVFSGVWIAASSPARAYLDPGSGSYAMQVGIAGVFGALFSLKLFWSKVKDALSLSRGKTAGKAKVRSASPAGSAVAASFSVPSSEVPASSAHERAV